jgi:AcrR family transcriptional regulator
MEARKRKDRLAKADYFEAGLRLLADGGAPAVTIANLGAALGVTKGSFYHHFQSGPAFMQELLIYWEDEYSLRLISEARTVPDPRARLETLSHMAANFHHEAENAIRALARTDPFAAAMQQRVDDARTAIVAETFRANGVAAREAARFAALSLATLVGAQQTVHPPEAHAIERLFDTTRELILGSLARRRTA